MTCGKYWRFIRWGKSLACNMRFYKQRSACVRVAGDLSG